MVTHVTWFFCLQYFGFRFLRKRIRIRLHSLVTRSSLLCLRSLPGSPHPLKGVSICTKAVLCYDDFISLRIHTVWWAWKTRNRDYKLISELLDGLLIVVRFLCLCFSMFVFTVSLLESCGWPFPAARLRSCILRVFLKVSSAPPPSLCSWSARTVEHESRESADNCSLFTPLSFSSLQFPPYPWLPPPSSLSHLLPLPWPVSSLPPSLLLCLRISLCRALCALMLAGMMWKGFKTKTTKRQSRDMAFRYVYPTPKLLCYRTSFVLTTNSTNFTKRQ